MIIFVLMQSVCMIKYLYKLIYKKVKKLKPLKVLKNSQIFELLH